MKTIAYVSLSIWKFLGGDKRFYWYSTYGKGTEWEGKFLHSFPYPSYWYYKYIHYPLYDLLYKHNGNKNLW